MKKRKQFYQERSQVVGISWRKNVEIYSAVICAWGTCEFLVNMKMHVGVRSFGRIWKPIYQLGRIINSYEIPVLDFDQNQCHRMPGLQPMILIGGIIVVSNTLKRWYPMHFFLLAVPDDGMSGFDLALPRINWWEILHWQTLNTYFWSLSQHQFLDIESARSIPD